MMYVFRTLAQATYHNFVLGEGELQSHHSHWLTGSQLKEKGTAVHKAPFPLAELKRDACGRPKAFFKRSF